MRIAVLVAVAGCWRGGGEVPAAEEPAAVTVAPVKAGPYRDVGGRWIGVGIQYDTQSEWDVVMKLHRDAPIGGRIGTIEYPSLPCRADLIRDGEEGDVLVMTEKITDGVDKCVDGGKIRIPRKPGSRLDWRWFFPSGEEGAKASLERMR